MAEDALLEGFDNVEIEPNGVRTYLSNAENVEINEAIHQVTEKYENQGIVFYYSGTPVFVAEMQKGIKMDMVTMMPLSMLLITVILYFLFRSEQQKAFRRSAAHQRGATFEIELTD